MRQEGESELLVRGKLLLASVSGSAVASNILLQILLLERLSAAEDQKIFVSCLAIPAVITAVVFGPYQNILVSKFCKRNSTHEAWEVATSFFALFCPIILVSALGFSLWSPVYFGEFMTSANQSSIYNCFLLLASGVPFNIGLAVIWAAAVAEEKIIELETIALLVGVICIVIAVLKSSLSPGWAALIYAIRYPLQLSLSTRLIGVSRIRINWRITRELLSGAEWASVLSLTGRFDQIAERMALVRVAGNTLTGYYMAQQIVSLVTSLVQKLVLLRDLPSFVRFRTDSSSVNRILSRSRRRLYISFFLVVGTGFFIVGLKQTMLSGLIRPFLEGFSTEGFIYCLSILTIAVLIGAYSEFYAGICHAEGKSNRLAAANAPVALIICGLKISLGIYFGWFLLPILTLLAYSWTLVVARYMSRCSVSPGCSAEKGL